MPPVRRAPGRLGPGSFAIVCAVLGLIPLGVATLGTPAWNWPTVSATAQDCHAGWQGTGKRRGHEVTRCMMRWADSGHRGAATVEYPLGDVTDGTVKPVRVNGSRAVDAAGLSANLWFAAGLSAIFLLIAGVLGWRWYVRGRRTVRR